MKKEKCMSEKHTIPWGNTNSYGIIGRRGYPCILESRPPLFFEDTSRIVGLVWGEVIKEYLHDKPKE